MVIVAHCRGGNCLVRIFQQRLASNILALFCVELLYPLEQVRSQNLILHVCCPVMKSCPTLWPRGLQHTRLPSPSPAPRGCSNSCPLSLWCHLTILSCLPLLLLPSIFHSIRDFSNESALSIRWPEYWSFSISPSKKHSGLISFRMDWLDPLAV